MIVDLNKLDYSDTKALFAFAGQTVNLAEEYRKARIVYAKAKAELNKTLAQSYKEGGVETKHSTEKAYLLLSTSNERVEELLTIVTESEENYKGLEEVLKARYGMISLAQSLMKLQEREA